MDCCRLTDLLLERIWIPIMDKPDPMAAGKVKRFYAFATGLGRTSRETPYNGIVRGIFSRILLDGLKGAASRDAQGRVTTLTLGSYLEAELKQVKINGEEQTPHFPCKDEIVLFEGRPPSCVTVRLRLTQPVAGIVVLDGGNNLAPVVPGDEVVTSDERQFPVPTGKTYLIQALDADGNPTRMTTIKADGKEVYATL